MKSIQYTLLSLLFLTACVEQKKEVVEQPQETVPAMDMSNLPAFNADSAFYFVQKQVEFGPRVPNSSGHQRCGDWLIQLLKQYADTVVVQKADLKAFDGKILKSRNIIASFNPSNTNRVMLSAHWDTRPFADQDVSKQDQPIDGANDGGSGVGILLEIARAYHLKRPEVGVDICLWDAEDYGQPEDSGFPYMENSYCLGSQYWSAHPHQPNYTAKWGILLDMCGGIGASFTKEKQSMNYAGNLMDRTWNNAAKLGYGSLFINVLGDPITDDHQYINSIAHIPTIDIIHRTESTRSGFAAYWHTHQDNMSSVDKNVLKAVGETVIYTVFEEH